ncbi:hypothetical protein GCM10023188_15800 [Pontibacter saemangeumensis]|uniref:TerB family tellurite resistance protein n=1 Tax=Pontibacter saemangeumensis TaxID=1084525 RepID=A0ABP8LIB8_9BACT
MKKLLMLLLFGMMATGTRAQTFAEWFRQEKTQKEYLLEQIAALRMYHGYVKKGYAIAREGLTAVGDSKEGEVDLHEEFFSSLERVNPLIRSEAKVMATIGFQVKIVQVCQSTYRQLQASGSFSGEDIGYVYRVFAGLLDDGAATLDELQAVTADDKLEMRDDERLERIGALYSDMQDNYTFAQSFSREAMVLAAARMQEKKDVQTSRGLNGIKQEEL